MNNIFAGYIYNLGVRLRNPSYSHIYNELKITEYSSLEQLLDLQNIKLDKLLRFASEYSPFYKERLKDLMFESDKLITVSDLKKIPITTKKDLIESNKEIHTIKNYKFKKLFFSETSGSSGEALTFYKNEKWDSYNRASIARGMSWYGVNPWEKNGYLWGYSFNNIRKLKTRFLDFFLNRFRLFSYDDKIIGRFLLELRYANYLSGYSSMIYECAKFVNAHGNKYNLKLVKGTSEKIYDHYNKESIRAFGNKIISEYGAAEAGIIAFECPKGGLHINEETCVVEVINDEILVTNLVSYSFPVIRYKLGDYVYLSAEKCRCGRSHRLIKDVLGRVGKNIYGRFNNYFPSLTLYYIFKRMALEHNINLNYTAIQNIKGNLIIKIKEDIGYKVHALIKQIANDYFADSVEIDIISGVEIHDHQQKLKDFTSTINE